MIRLLRVIVGLLVLAALLVSPTPSFADSVAASQWHLGFLKIPIAHQISDGNGVTVAVVDTGVDDSHPDLFGAVSSGIDLASASATSGRQDANGHGTYIAGLIAAHGHGSGQGVTGIAPKSRILAVRTSVSGIDATSNTALGIRWAVRNHARVVCIALGGAKYDELEESVQFAMQSDVVIVAAAGNAPGTRVAWPAAYHGVVAVGAVDMKGNRAAVSVTGPELVLTAPGVDVVSTSHDHGYMRATGTSGAAAIVAGVAALVRSRYPQLSAAEVIHRMTATATDKGPPGRDDEYGYGIVNPVAALTADVPPLSPSAAPTTQPSGVDKQSEGLPTGRRGVSPVLVVAVVVLLVVGAVATWLLIQDRARESADHDRTREDVDHDSAREHVDQDRTREGAAPDHVPEGGGPGG